MAQIGNSSAAIAVESSSGIGDKASKAWAAVKPGVVLALKATEMGLDGLPIPGAKGCVGLILQLIETADIASDNVDALEALQSRFETLQDVLKPIYANKAVNIPEDVRKDVENLARKLDKLAAQWKEKMEKTRKKRHFLRRLLNAEDDRDTLAGFVTAVDQTVQDFLVVTTTNGRIAAFKESIKNQEAHTLLNMPRAPAASYNSVRTGGANTCLEGTRTTILQTIRAWATAADPSLPPMFWLNGLAGIGKTTIAHTIAANLDEAGLLGGSFVFLRADDQLKDVRLVFPTLAFQLAHHNPLYKTRLVEVLELDPDCGSKRLDLQFEKLILRPFSSVPLASPTVLILDALDECYPERLTKELLRIIHRNIQKVPFLRVFITSRPEGYIREALDLVDPTAPHSKLVLHEDSFAQEVEHDIRLFLQMNLQGIWNRRTKRVDVRWPSDKDLDALVKQSGKLFVYAATAVRFIGGNPTLNVDRQLSILLSVKIGHVPRGEPYRQLDALYLEILKSVFADCTDDYYDQRFRDIVGSIVLLERPLRLETLANFLGTYTTLDIRQTLYHLHSIIIIPESDTEAPRTYHLSFPNFITNAERCTVPRAYIDPGQQAKYLFLRCMATMQQGYDSASVESDLPLPFEWSIPDDSGEPDDTRPDDSGEPDDTNRDDPGEPANIRQGFDFRPVDRLRDDFGDEDELSGRRSSMTLSSLDDDPEVYYLSREMRYSEDHWCRHLMKIPHGDKETVEVLEQFLRLYLSKWVRVRLWFISSSNSKRFAGPVQTQHQLIRHAFDVMHDAYQWGASSECSPKQLLLLKRTAESVFATLHPALASATFYRFGRLNDSLPGLERVAYSNSSMDSRSIVVGDVSQVGRSRREARV